VLGVGVLLVVVATTTAAATETCDSLSSPSFACFARSCFRSSKSQFKVGYKPTCSKVTFQLYFRRCQVKQTRLGFRSPSRLMGVDFHV